MRLDRNDFLAQVTTRLGLARIDALAWVGLATAYALLATLSLHIAAIPDTTAYWPSTGLVFAAAALWGPRFWPAVQSAFDAFKAVRLRSPLSIVPAGIMVPAFPRRSRPWLLTTAAHGGLGPTT
jgi:hypothetical protein